MTFKKIILWITVSMMVLSAAVQLNDTDPATWIAAYLLVAFVGIRKISGKNDRYWIAALVYAIWGINQFPPEWEGVVFSDVGMKTLNIELGRESFGLLICSGILFVYEFY
ncbi:MAG: ABC-type nickel/cobalt efflux system permease component RcnA [Algoriphagus sp.]|jgi:ABC-type nickel/cobalt efflux system permease component RcnA